MITYYIYFLVVIITITTATPVIILFIIYNTDTLVLYEHPCTIEKRILDYNPNMSTQSNTSYLRRNSWPISPHASCQVRSSYLLNLLPNLYIDITILKYRIYRY